MSGESQTRSVGCGLRVSRWCRASRAASMGSRSDLHGGRDIGGRGGRRSPARINLSASVGVGDAVHGFLLGSKHVADFSMRWSDHRRQVSCNDEGEKYASQRKNEPLVVRSKQQVIRVVFAVSLAGSPLSFRSCR